MWSAVLIPLMTMAIGFLIGFIVADGSSRNMQIDNLRKEINKLRRQIEVRRRQNEGSETGDRHKYIA